MSEKPWQLSRQLLRCASARLASPTDLTEGDLRRATSDLYYSLFHRVAEAMVEPLGSGPPSSQAFREVLETLYRLPEHKYLVDRCRDVVSHEFHEGVKVFAKQLTIMKHKREEADYHPLARFELSAVLNDAQLVRNALNEFDQATQLERSRFAYFVGIKGAKKTP